MRYLLVGTLALLVFTPAAFGHGSCYRGPCQEVPPGQRYPVPPCPPLPTVDASSPGTWEWWWSLNKEEFLYPEATRERKDGEPGRLEASIFEALEKALRDEMTCPARSRVALAAGAVAASRGGAPESLLDRLRELSLDRKQQRVVQACTAVALGMAGQRDEAVVTALSGTALDGKAAYSVRGAAALAIGLLGVSRSTGEQHSPLAWSTLDTAAASDSADLRACALVAMGLDGSAERIPAVLQVLGNPPSGAGSPTPGTPSAYSDKSFSLVITGLCKFADMRRLSHSAEVVKTLTGIVLGSAPHSRRAAVAALGRWGSIETLNERTALKAVNSLRGAAMGDDPLAARLAVLSLAQIGRSSSHDRVLVEVTQHLISTLSEPQRAAAPYAALSLGILSRSGTLPERDRETISGLLRGELLSLHLAANARSASPGPGGPRVTPPMAPPVGPGSPGVTPPVAPPPGSVTPVPAAPSSPDAPTVMAPSRSRTDTPPVSPTGSPKKPDRIAPGAYALALGLIGDETAAPLLTTVVEDPAAHSRLRGYAAVALGMLHSKPGMESVCKVVRGATDADLLVLGAIGAGLAGDASLLPDLLLRTSDSSLTNRARTMAIRAVGKLGDRSAIPGLLEIVGNKDASDVVRSTAAIAIADLYDKDGALVLTRLTRDLSAYAKNDTFDLILSVF